MTDPLTPLERQELRTWRLAPLELPTHSVIRYQLKRGLDGAEHTILTGPPGVGKTFAVRTELAALEAAEGDRTLNEPEVSPRAFLYYASSAAAGTKTALVDLAEHVMPTLSAGAKRRSTPTHLTELCGQECRDRSVRLIVIDEAHHIAPAQLDLLRQVPDYTTEELGYTMSLFLIGNEQLKTALVDIGQFGQRFSAQITMPRFKASDLKTCWHTLHPHLERLETRLSASEWRKLNEAVFGKLLGSLRRLGQLLKNANDLALQLNRRLDSEVLLMALDELTGEA